MIFDDSAGLFAVSEARKLRVSRRAKLQTSHPESLHVLAQPCKVAVFDPLPMRISLAPDGQAERIGVQVRLQKEAGGPPIHGKILWARLRTYTLSS
jgi:hypothetical protein